MTIKEKALYKIESKRMHANIQLSAASTYYNRLTMQNDIDEDGLENSENSVLFYGRE